MLANGPLGDADAMTGEENGADLRGRAGGQLDPQSADLVKELRMAADSTQVGARVGLEAVQSLLAVGADPTVEGAARVFTLAAIWMLVQLVRQLAHQPSAIGGTEPRTDGFGNDTVAEQRDGFGGLGGHGVGPPTGNGAIQSAPAPDAQGEVVWVPSAWPPLIRLQNDHRSPLPTPNRARARCQATPRLASAACSPMALTSTGVPSRATASAAHSASNVGDRAWNRCHHDRTVVCGTSSCSAIGRSPSPRVSLRAKLAPITATASRRRTSTRSGSSACDRRHAEHRPRRIQIRSTSNGARNQRQ
jgi:hypothetical protein